MLTLQYVPYSKINNLSSDERVDALLDIVAENKIVLLQGKLRKGEEAMLIQRTMERIGENSENIFKGIELSTIDADGNSGNKIVSTLRNTFANVLFGNRQGMTVVGPASIVKEIKQDPEKIELMLSGVVSDSQVKEVETKEEVVSESSEKEKKEGASKKAKATKVSSGNVKKLKHKSTAIKKK